MSKRWRRIILVACGIVAFVVVWQLFRDREPSYQGRTLSQWIDQARGSALASQIEEARGAIRAIGTNAIPICLKWITYEPSRLRGRITGLLQRLPPDLRRRLFFKPAQRADDAVRVIRILGPQARAAMPELARLARTTSDHERLHRCISALTSLGPEALPYVLNLVTNSPPFTRRIAILKLPDFRTDAAMAAPILIQCLEDTDTSVADAVADTLTKLDRSAVFPCLTNALHSPSAQVRAHAVNCIQWLWIPLSEASPLLDPLLTDPDYNVRRTTTNALHRLIRLRPPARVRYQDR